jgi:hypothetical protein
VLKLRLLDVSPRLGYRRLMVKVAQRGRVAVYVYAEEGQPHSKPHCHVVWKDGKAVIELPSGHRLAGHRLPAAARELVLDEMDELVGAWDRLNPGRPVR